jgi:hypothetical protein
MSSVTPEETHTYTIIIRILSAVSLAFSLSVVVTILRFEVMQKKLFFKCILMISLADMGTSIVSTFGFLSSGPLCTVQGLGGVFFPVASWCWTTILSYAIFSIIRYERVIVNMKLCHLICWGLPACCAFLPLITSRYGPASINLQWCIIVPRSNSPEWVDQFWVFASFFGWFLVFVVLMWGWSFYVFYRLIWQQTVATQVVQRIYNKLWLYPVAMFICWAVNFVVIEYPDKVTARTAFISMAFGVSNGIWSTLIFFFKSSEARSRWYYVVYPRDSKDEPVTGTQANDFSLETVEGGLNRTNGSQSTTGGTNASGPAAVKGQTSGTSIIARNTLANSLSYNRRSDMPGMFRGMSRTRFSVRSQYIIEDFDVDDDGDGKAVAYSDDFASVTDQGWGSGSEHSMTPSSMSGPTVTNEMYRNYSVGMEMRGSLVNVGVGSADSSNNVGISSVDSSLS